MEKFSSRLEKIIRRPFSSRKKQFKICKGINVNTDYPRTQKENGQFSNVYVCVRVLLKLKMVFILYTLVP